MSRAAGKAFLLVASGAAPDDERWKVGTPLYWAVLGIGTLLIRFSSSHGWWTGHLM